MLVIWKPDLVNVRRARHWTLLARVRYVQQEVSRAMSALRIAADRAKALEPHIVAKVLGANGANDHFSSGHNGVAVERCGLGPRARGGGAQGGGGVPSRLNEYAASYFRVFPGRRTCAPFGEGILHARMGGWVAGMGLGLGVRLFPSASCFQVQPGLETVPL